MARGVPPDTDTAGDSRQATGAATPARSYKGTMVSTQTQTTTSVWTIDPAHSNVEFAVKHMMFTTVKGRFAGVDGQIELNEQDLADSFVNVTIDVNSVDTREEKRNAHLRSADFFDVEQHPEMTFKSTKVESDGDDEFKVIGDLTIRGVTRPVVRDVEQTGRGTNPWGQEVIGFEARTKINRKDYGLNWNAALESGGVLVSDDVKISLDIQAHR